MEEIFLTRDTESGLIDVKITPENKLLKEFFETEIQDDMALIDYLVTKATHQEGKDFEITGNAFSLTLTPDRYSITPLYEDRRSPQGGPRRDFFLLLDYWRQFLENEHHKN
ncbi:hypothetical protein J0X12_16055 [Sneathiella sp. CAU 1612]|jgi:hypothetical protein|uniref:Uncharacterized protein n=1 Tax=Sneathiella sedimenti TaxID=2816034 RepID=A0ABS3F9E5_9PROT|nr:hypothetical protein [Sneathiella sedimenti]MBO0335136.1 hypothetical protein [Sneathiella sedimenti]